MLVHAPSVASQALGYVLGGVVEGGMGVARLALAAQGEAAAGMNIDIAGEKAAGPAESDAGLHGVVEILWAITSRLEETARRASDRSTCLPETLICMSLTRSSVA